MPPEVGQNIFNILPVTTIELILGFATSCNSALSTDPSAILDGQKETASRYRHFRPEILETLPTKVALSLVSKQIAELNERYLLEAICITSCDLLPSLGKLLGSPSLADKARTKGDCVKRLDFRLGREGRYWSGEGHQKHFRDLYRLLPHLTSLQLLLIDPYTTNYLQKVDITLKLPKAFWKILVGTCGKTLRLLSIGNVEVDPRHLVGALSQLENLESLEIQGGWYGSLPELSSKTSKIPLKKLHHLHVYIVEALPGFTFPALQNAFVSSNIPVFETDGFGWQIIGKKSLSRFTFCGPTVDIFELGLHFPNLQHFAVHKLRNSHFTHSWWSPRFIPNGIGMNGSEERIESGDNSTQDEENILSKDHATIPNEIGSKKSTVVHNKLSIIYSLRTITIYHYHVWPFGRSIVDNILELRERQALPGLEEVRYVEHDGWVRKDSNIIEVEKALATLEETFKRAGVKLINERRCLSLD